MARRTSAGAGLCMPVWLPLPRWVVPAWPGGACSPALCKRAPSRHFGPRHSTRPRAPSWPWGRLLANPCCSTSGRPRARRPRARQHRPAGLSLGARLPLVACRNHSGGHLRGAAQHPGRANAGPAEVRSAPFSRIAERCGGGGHRQRGEAALARRWLAGMARRAPFWAPSSWIIESNERKPVLWTLP